MRPARFLSLLFVVGAAFSAAASTPLTTNPLVPLQSSGGMVNAHTGALAFGLPLGTVPGEIPIPVSFGIESLYRVDRYNTPTYVLNPDGTRTINGYMTLNAIRPTFGTVHFGFIRNKWQYGQYINEPVITLLEDGQEYDGSTAFSGATLTLPQAYGFAAPTSPMVDDTSAHLFYDTTSTGLSSTAANLVNTHLPSGFGTASTTYKVVMDKSLVRVFASVPALSGWVPVLWMDRFGHTVTFQWTRATTGLAAGITAQTSVVAMNARGKGVEIRWADWSSGASVQDLARIDFLGMAAPAMLVRGYPGVTSTAPAGFASTLLSSAPTATATAPVSVKGGPVGRPTEILSGDPQVVPQPSWNNSGPAPAAQPTTTTSTSPSVPTFQWLLQWDANAATVLSLTSGILGLPNASTRRVATFTYQACTTDAYTTGAATNAVTQTDESDGAGNQHHVTWARTPAADPAPTSVTLQDWWTALGAADHTWVYSSFDANDVPGSTVLKDASGATLATTTSGSSGPTATTYAASVGMLNTQTTTSATATFTTQPTQITFSVANGTGAWTMVQQTNNTYLDRSAMLEDSAVTKAVISRYTASSTLIAPARTVVNAFDMPGTGQLPLLQVQKTYQQQGAWLHGATLAYDADGRLSTRAIYDSPDGGATTSPAPQSMTYAYDSTTGAPASVITTYPTGSGSGTATLTQSWSGFDTLSRPALATDATGVSTATSVDLLGRVYHAARPGQPTVDVSWAGDNSTRTTTAGSQTTTDTYDGFGRLQSRVGPDGCATTFSYDPNGRKSQQVVTAAAPDPVSGIYGTQTTSWTYDALGRVTSETGPDGVKTTFSYSLSGLSTVKTAVNTATNLKVVETADPFGQVVSRVVSDLQNSAYVVVKSAAFTYDGVGHLTQAVETDPGGVSQTRTFTYDANGRLTSKVEPETGTQTFSTFNALGQPTQINDGVRIRTAVYDGLGRLVSAASGADSLGYTYTGAQLTNATSVSSGQTITQTFSYGSAASGALLASEATQTPDFSATISYGYMVDGKLQTLTYPSGRVVTYGYKLGEVQTVSQTAPGGMTGGTVATVGYDPAWGLESSLQFASGAMSVWTTQTDGIHLKQWSIQLPSGTKLDVDRVYTYDSISKNGLSQAGEWSLTHDTRGRLTQASASTLNSFAATYGYDAFDNNTSAALSGTTPPQAIGFGFTALPKNQTPATTTGGSATGWTYDAAGEGTNLGAGVGSTPQTGLVWDGLGRMSQVNAPGLTEVEGYAPSGMRVRRDDSVTGLSRRYAYTSNGLLLGEYVPATGGGWQWNRDVIYLGSQAIAETDANGLHELHSDHLGTPRVITTASGGTAVIEGRQNFGPYGELFPAMNSGYAPLTGYTGHIQTDPTGLIYMRGRFYTPIWHRFMNSDQGADSSTFNQMAYVSGSPVMSVDPSGMVINFTIGDDSYTAKDWTQFYQMLKELLHGGSYTVIWNVSGTPSPVGNYNGWGYWGNGTLTTVGTNVNLGRSGGSPTSAQAITPVLNEGKCKLIREMLAYEAKHGTWATGRYFSNTWPGGDKGETTSGIFTNPYPYKNETPTQFGAVDMDWFLTIVAFSGPRGPGGMSASGSVYAPGKLLWEGISAVDAAIHKGKYSEGDYHFEMPGEDPGESNAHRLFQSGKTLRDLFPDDWMKKYCGGSN